MWIISHFPIHDRYVEPFGGGASVLLHKPIQPWELYNDLDKSIFNFFRVLRDDHEALIAAIELTPWSRVELDFAPEPTDDPVEAARRVYIMAYQAHFGQRVRWKRSWRYGARRGPNQDYAKLWSTVDHLAAVAWRLKHVQLECGDAFDIIARCDTSDTLFYLDPPYLQSVRRRGSSDLYLHDMTDDDHRRLAELIHGLKGMVLLSGYESDLYSELYSDWTRSSTISINGRGGTTKEILWMNQQAARSPRQLTLGISNFVPEE